MPQGNNCMPAKNVRFWLLAVWGDGSYNKSNHHLSPGLKTTTWYLYRTVDLNSSTHELFKSVTKMERKDVGYKILSQAASRLPGQHTAIFIIFISLYCKWKMSMTSIIPNAVTHSRGSSRQSYQTTVKRLQRLSQQDVVCKDLGK